MHDSTALLDVQAIGKAMDLYRSAADEQMEDVLDHESGTAALRLALLCDSLLKVCLTL